MLKVFIGYDERQPISYQVLHYSILKYASVPVSITPLVLNTLPIKRVGLTPFTYSRFLVPLLCDYQGSALFLDADMLLTDDIKKLFDHFDPECDVSVVKNTKRFEWASVMLFNNEKCKVLTPEYIENGTGLHTITWANKIGDIPAEWNFLSGYDEKPAELPKLIHYTQGLPCFPEMKKVDYNEQWLNTHSEMNSAKSWTELMGPSVHAVEVNGVRLPKYLFDFNRNPVMPFKHFDETVKELLHVDTWRDGV